VSFTENRVTVKEYGSLPYNSDLLVNIPTARGCKQQRLHIIAADYLAKLSLAAKQDLDLDILIASGWRNHRWSSFEQYKDFVIKKYGSLEKGRKYLAFDSPHETGLAVDFGCGGLWPSVNTMYIQKQTLFYKWLVNNAYKFNYTPYLNECWHFECKLPLDVYKGGKIENVVAPSEPITTCSDPNDVCIELPWVSSF
jgi:hypothetical protein